MSTRTKIFEIPTNSKDVFTQVEEVEEIQDEIVEDEKDDVIEEVDDKKGDDASIEEETEVENEEDEKENNEGQEEVVDDNVVVEDPTKEVAFYVKDILKEQGYDLFGEEVPEDLSLSMIRENFKEHIKTDVEEEIRTEVLSQLSEQGINEETLQYAMLIQSGSNLQTLSDAEVYKQYSQVPDDSDDEIKRELIKVYLKDQNTSEKNIERLMSSIEVDESLDEEFENAKTYFSKRNKDIIALESQNAQKRKEREAQEFQEKKRQVDNLINDKDLGGFKLSTAQAKDLKKSLYNANEIVEIDGKKYKTTEFQKFLYAINSDIRLQLELFARNKYREDILDTTEKNAKKDYEDKLISSITKIQKNSQKEEDESIEENNNNDKPVIVKKTKLFEISTNR